MFFIVRPALSESEWKDELCRRKYYMTQSTRNACHNTVTHFSANNTKYPVTSKYGLRFSSINLWRGEFIFWKHTFALAILAIITQPWDGRDRLKSVLDEDKDTCILYIQWHCCWSQGISIPDNDLIIVEYCRLSIRKLPMRTRRPFWKMAYDQQKYSYARD